MEPAAGGRKINRHHTPFFFPLQAPSPILNTPSIHTFLQKKNNLWRLTLPSPSIPHSFCSSTEKQPSALSHEGRAVQEPESSLGIENMRVPAPHFWGMLKFGQSLKCGCLRFSCRTHVSVPKHLHLVSKVWIVSSSKYNLGQLRICRTSEN